MSIPKYVSAEEYSRQSGMGVEEVKRQCRIGEVHQKVKDENTRLKTILETILNTAKQV